jgi:hypothetical protein
MNFEELVSILQGMPEPAPVFYRLYHDADGGPLFYSMEDVPGTYINIGLETYLKNSMRVKVVDGKLIEFGWKVTNKLIPSTDGTACDTRDIAVVVGLDTPNTKWSKKTYESN